MKSDRFVFLNVPFDPQYQKLIRALVFAVHDCGLVARCALETDDGGDVRINKIYKIVEQCRLGIHDLSRTTLDTKYRLPRFNMPLELGIFLGARHFGRDAQRKKSLLILDRDPYRSKIYCSDIAGQDIRGHDNKAEGALAAVRNWLQTALHSGNALPSAGTLIRRYLQFRRRLPLICRENDLTVRELTFIDLRRLTDAWIEDTPARS